MSKFTVTPATTAQAEAICQVLRRSIQEICAPDYDNDPQVMADWLENKTPENIEAWVADPDTYSVVAVSDGEIIGFGHASPTEILLNYALPEYLGQGVGHQVLSELEGWARSQGSSQLTCTSTATALSFYERQGYRRSGKPIYYGGKAGDFPLAKDLGE